MLIFKKFSYWIPFASQIVIFQVVFAKLLLGKPLVVEINIFPALAI